MVNFTIVWIVLNVTQHIEHRTFFLVVNANLHSVQIQPLIGPWNWRFIASLEHSFFQMFLVSKFFLKLLDKCSYHFPTRHNCQILTYIFYLYYHNTTGSTSLAGRSSHNLDRTLQMQWPILPKNLSLIIIITHKLKRNDLVV